MEEYNLSILTLEDKEQIAFHSSYDIELMNELKSEENDNMLDRYIRLFDFWKRKLERDKENESKRKFILFMLSCLTLECKSLKIWSIIKSMLFNQDDSKESQKHTQ